MSKTPEATKAQASSRPKHRRHFSASHPDPASPPGTLVPPIRPADGDVVLRVIRYDATSMTEEVITSPVADDLPELDADDKVWVDIQSLTDLDILRAVGARYGLHRLTMEDVLLGGGRARHQAYGDYVYVVIPRPQTDDKPSGPDVITHSVSVVLAPRAVITLHDVREDAFAHIRDRLHVTGSQIRHYGSDYLAYAVIDAVIDEYYPLIEQISERLDTLETVMVTDPDPKGLLEVRHIKDDLLVLRRAIRTLREVVAELVRDESGAFKPETRPYLRNCYAHTVELMELVEIHREMAMGLTDLFLAVQNNRMSEVMKVLTLIATIFIPLTFVVGIYGMNFDPDSSPYNMPELRAYWGYPTVMLIMALITGGMLTYFRRKRWL